MRVLVGNGPWMVWNTLLATFTMLVVTTMIVRVIVPLRASMGRAMRPGRRVAR